MIKGKPKKSYFFSGLATKKIELFEAIKMWPLSSRGGGVSKKNPELRLSFYLLSKNYDKTGNTYKITINNPYIHRRTFI